MFNRIEIRPEFQAIGLEINARYEATGEIPVKRQEFMQRWEEIPNTVSRSELFGIALRDGAEDFDYFICLEVSSIKTSPAG